MSERERWIIYPLLFFALGAALRDKFLQHVTTKELTATEIVCEKITVTDPAKPDRVVAQLASGTPPGGDEKANSYGLLVLFDSEGNELCGVANNTLQVGQVNAKSIAVVDQQNPQRVLARLTSATATTPDGKTHGFGSLLLNDDQGVPVFWLVNDQMQMRSIACQGIAITDPANPARALAVLGSALVQPENGDAPPQSVGMLQLNNERFIGLRGNPTEAPFESPPTPEQSASAADAEPAGPTTDAATKEREDPDSDEEDAAPDGASADETN